MGCGCGKSAMKRSGGSAISVQSRNSTTSAAPTRRQLANVQYVQPSTRQVVMSAELAARRAQVGKRVVV